MIQLTGSHCSQECLQYIQERKQFYAKNGHYQEMKKLIDDVRECDKCIKKHNEQEKYLINIFRDYKDDNKKILLPYTTNYWSDVCFHIPADIVFLGQDWGGESTVKNYVKNNRGESGNPTRGKLEAGIDRIDCRERSFFINSIICLREGNDTTKKHFDYKFISNCIDHILDHLKIVKPKIVVAIGQEVSERYVDLVDNRNFYDVSSQPYWDDINKWFVFPIYHLGDFGQLSRKRFGVKGKYVSDDYLTDFDLIKLLLISIYIVNCIDKHGDFADMDIIKNWISEKLPEYKNDINDITMTLQKSGVLNLVQNIRQYDDKVKQIYETIANELIFSKGRFKKNIKPTQGNKPKIVYDNKTTYWFINVGEYDNDTKEHVRYWDNNKKYGFISFGHGGINTDLMNNINFGDHLFAYISKHGYVGCGKITDPVKEVDEFKSPDGKSINDMDLLGKDFLLAKGKDCEYFIPVKWDKTIEKTDAIWSDKYSAYRLTFCRMHDQELIKRLIKDFNLK